MLATDYSTRTELDERAAFYARESQDEKVVDRRGEWLVFDVEGELFAVRVEELDEVASPQRGSALPGVHPSILGLLNLRGETMLLVDLGRAIGLRQGIPPSAPEQRILVVADGQGARTALLIDRVQQVADGNALEFKDILSKVDEKAKTQARLVNAVAGMDGMAVGRLDTERLLDMIRQWAAG